MANRNRIFRIASLLMVLCLVSTAMISGTFAKYTSEYSGQDTVLVARWSLTSESLGGTDLELPIWNHDYVTNIYGKTTIDEKEYYLIAPGVEGQFKIDFSYDADVDAELTFKLDKSGSAIDLVPIQYSIDEFATVYYDLEQLADAIIYTYSTDSTAEITGSNGAYVITNTATPEGSNPAGPITVSQTISWRWPYDVREHNGLRYDPMGMLIYGVAKDRAEAGFAGTGVGIKIQNPGIITDYLEWTDADDTIAGLSSATTDRDDYVLTLTIKAEQIAPTIN